MVLVFVAHVSLLFVTLLQEIQNDNDITCHQTVSLSRDQQQLSSHDNKLRKNTTKIQINDKNALEIVWFGQMYLHLSRISTEETGRSRLSCYNWLLWRSQ